MDAVSFLTLSKVNLDSLLTRGICVNQFHFGPVEVHLIFDNYETLAQIDFQILTFHT